MAAQPRGLARGESPDLLRQYVAAPAPGFRANCDVLSVMGNFIPFGEVGTHAEVGRVPGALAIAFCAKPRQDLIVPTGNEKEATRIPARPGFKECHVDTASSLDELVDYFRGKLALQPAIPTEGLRYESVIPRAVDFGAIAGQGRAKGAACLATAGGHNLLMMGTNSPMTRKTR